MSSPSHIAAPPLPPDSPQPSSRTQPPGAQESVRAVWHATMATLRTLARRSVVDAWFDKVVPLDAGPDGFVLEVPDEHFRDVIRAQHLGLLQQAIAANGLGTPHVELIVAQDEDAPDEDAQAPAHFADFRPQAAQGKPEAFANSVPASAAPQLVFDLPPPAPGDHASGGFGAQAGASPWSDAPTPDGSSFDVTTSLVSRFTFANFVEGDSNQLALSAAKTVAEQPGEAVNPVFVYGGVGLGKTHLLHAIGNAIRARHPQLRVRYVPAETFADDTISAMRSRDASVRVDVRTFYRNVDVLLLDDIQFLQGKGKTQDELFHTFNALSLAGKQIVLSCDRFPSELHDFHERLRSRFENGLTIGISPPDRDLRIAILRQRATQLLHTPPGMQGLPLPLDVLYYLADHLRNNVRELEGALHKLHAHAKLGKRPIDLTLARAALGPMIEQPSRHLTVEVIQRVTAQHYGLRVTDLKGAKRHRGVVVPRMVAVWLTRKHTQASFPEIGRAFGGRDHSTAIHACQKIDWLLQTDAAVQSAIQAIETGLGK